VHNRRVSLWFGSALVLLLVLLVACEGYTQSGASTKSYQTASGGGVTVRIGKANGTAEESIETDASSGLVLDAAVTLAVGQGSYRIELLGEDGEVTLTLEAGAGETVQGQGQMMTDAFGEANYRVTAVEAEDVEYVIEYVFR
jgi:hypothetical protein